MLTPHRPRHSRIPLWLCLVVTVTATSIMSALRYICSSQNLNGIGKLPFQHRIFRNLFDPGTRMLKLKLIIWYLSKSTQKTFLITTVFSSRMFWSIFFDIMYPGVTVKLNYVNHMKSIVVIAYSYPFRSLFDHGISYCLNTSTASLSTFSTICSINL